MTTRAIVTCTTCGKDRPNAAKGLCSPCYVRMRYLAGTPVACPRCERVRLPFGKGMCKSCYQITLRQPDASRHGSALHRERISAAQADSPNRREKSGKWKGGRFTDREGYVRILPPDDYEGRLIHGGRYVHEHRLVAEMTLGRVLWAREVVHHVNRNREDNRPRNLMVLPSTSVHRRLHVAEDRALREIGLIGLEELPLITRIAVQQPGWIRDGVDALADMTVMDIADDREAALALGEAQKLFVGMYVGLRKVLGDLTPVDLA